MNFYGLMSRDRCIGGGDSNIFRRYFSDNNRLHWWLFQDKLETHQSRYGLAKNLGTGNNNFKFC